MSENETAYTAEELRTDTLETSVSTAAERLDVASKKTDPTNDADGVCVVLGVADPDAVIVGVGVDVAVCVTLWLPEGVWLAVFVSVALTLDVCDCVTVPEGVGDGVCVPDADAN